MTRLFQIAAALAVIAYFGPMAKASIEGVTCHMQEALNSHGDWGSACQ